MQHCSCCNSAVLIITMIQNTVFLTETMFFGSNSDIYICVSYKHIYLECTIHMQYALDVIVNECTRVCVDV